MAEFRALPREAQRILADWVKKWYLKAGYKRLGRYLIDYAKECQQDVIARSVKKGTSGHVQSTLSSSVRKHDREATISELAQIHGSRSEDRPQPRKRGRPKKYPIIGASEVLSINRLYEHLDKDIPYEDIDEPGNKNDDSPLDHDRNLVSRSVERQHYAAERKEILERALSLLKPREREIIERSFGYGEFDEMSLVEISQIMNVSRERIRQIKDNALRKLKKFVRKRT
jgi:RNA polymerase sigma factor (sigma-70 family)